MMNKGMFSSDSCEWETPQAFFDTVNGFYHFDLDVCASHSNAR